jgi:hypothetical protein
MEFHVREMKLDAVPRPGMPSRIRIEIAKRLQLRSVVLIVCERYRGKYKEARERDA